MEDKHKIEKMKNEGRITPEQAELLLHAVNESEQRRQEILEDIKAQKKSRNSKFKGLMGAGLFVALMGVSVLLHLAIANSPGRDVQKALQEFGQAAGYFEKQNYAQAIESIEKGIEKAPRFFLGYSMLGMTYRMMHNIDQKQNFKTMASEAFVKAQNLRNQQTGRGHRRYTGMFFLVIFLLLILSVVFLLLLLLYNILVRREEDASESWALVATYCQRKFDLVPAVMDAVKDFVGHEHETFKAVSEARSQADSALQKAGAMTTEDDQKLDQIGGAEDALSLAMGKVTALAEQYPELKTNTNYLAVQDQLAETENQIAYARQVYNQKVKKYNTGLRTFPFNLMAAAFGFGAKTYFGTTE
jgi:LemA protein